MSPNVCDVLCIKTIEKEIGRKLDDLEMEVIRLGEPIFLQDRNNNWLSRFVPLYRFPYDVMVTEADLAASAEHTGIFDYAFNAGHGVRGV